MRFIVTIRQQVKYGFPYTLGKYLAISVLLAVPILSMSYLSADLVASWQGGNAEAMVLTTNSTSGVLAFDAPATTLRQYQFQVKDSSSTTEQAEKATQPSLLVKDWRYTAQSANLNPTVNNFVNTLVPQEFILDTWLVSAGMPSNAVSLVMAQQYTTNLAILQELSAISHMPLDVQRINGFIGNLVLNQLILNNMLMSNGVPSNAMLLLLSQQLSFDEVLYQNLLLAAPPNVQPGPPQPASPSH